MSANAHSHKPRSPQVPIGPVKDWCHTQVRLLASRHDPHDPRYGPHQELADRMGLNSRALYRIMQGHYSGARNGRKGEFPAETISRNYVEDMLTRAGVDFYSVYPELEYERDIALEPDEFCRRCGEWITPIEGFCPWCESNVGWAVA